MTDRAAAYGKARDQSRTLIPAGTRFGRLVIVAFDHSNQAGKRSYRCSCDCGNDAIVRTTELRSGKTKSCGCLHREQLGALNRTHGLSDTPTYSSWRAMVRRCSDPTVYGWEHYGGANPPVLVADRWRGYETFLTDMGERPSGTTLGRYGDVGNYEPGNCAWMTKVEQVAEQVAKRGSR